MDGDIRELKRIKKEKKRRRRRRLAAPFFITLFTLCVISFISPLRPTVSEKEKRELAAFPDFSVKALISGDWFDGIGTWFSDTFPGRERWLDLSSWLDSLHGVNKNVVDMSLIHTVPAPAETFEPKPVPSAAPVEAVQTEETAEEELSVESVSDWEGMSFSADEDVVFGNTIQIGDKAFEYYGFNASLLDTRAWMMNTFAGIMEECGVRFFDMPIPSAVGVLISPEVLSSVRCANQAETLDYIFSSESESILKVNALNNLVKHTDEYIYFRTDHHWTALGAYYAYEQFCRTAGFEPVPLENYTTMNMGEFLGTFYTASPMPGKLTSDELIAYCPPGNVRFQIIRYDGSLVDYDLVRDMTYEGVFSKYTAFIAGDNPLSVIINDDLPDAPNCAIIKDSYGNPFSIFLSQHYHKVYVIDYRDYTRATIRQFTQDNDISDVIMAESISLTQGEGANNLISYYIMGS